MAKEGANQSPANHLEDVSTDYKENSQKFWSFIKSKGQEWTGVAPLKNKMGFLQSDNKSKVEILNEQFQSVFTKDQRLPGACNRSPGSKLLSITTQLHCNGHLSGRAQLPDTILEEDHPMTIPSKFGFN